MLYQFLDGPGDNSIQQIIKKRVSVVDATVVFMTDFSNKLFKDALDNNYKVGGFTFANLLGTNHSLGKESFTIKDFIGNDDKFILLKKEKNTAFYMYSSNILVKVRTAGEEVVSVTYSYPDYTKTDYYCGKLIYRKWKNNNSEDTEITFYDNEGSVFYISPKENHYFYKGVEYTSKQDFYNKLLSEYSFTSKDILAIDWCKGFESIICKNKQESKVVVPLHSEMINASSIYPRTEFFEHANMYLDLLFYINKCNRNIEPYCELRDICKYIADSDNKIDAIYTQTEKMKGILEQHIELGLLPKMDVEVYRLLDSKITPNRSKGSKKICSVSQISPIKRVDWLIKAVFFAHKIDPEITLDIYGTWDKHYLEVLYQLVSELQAEDYIKFKGWLTDKTKKADYSIFMNTSIMEGYCLSVLEALSCGCAIVGTDIVGHSYLTKDNSILVSIKGKTENQICLDLSKAIIEALNRFDELSKGAIEFAKTEYDKKIIDENIKKLFIM